MRAPVPARTRLRRLLPVAALTAALTAAWPAAAAAQRAADLLPAGARVRLYFPRAAHASSAEFVRASGDSLWVRYAGAADTAAVARANLRELRVFRGLAPRRVGRSAARGLLVGAAAGAVFGAGLAVANPEDADFFGGVVGATAFFAGLGAAPGLVIGALAGIARPEVWARVPVR